MRPLVRKLALVLIPVALMAACLWYSTLKDTIPRFAWFYDINTGALFAGDVTALPPIEAPSDTTGQFTGREPAGVLARVIRKRGQHDQVIVLLTKYTTKAQELIRIVRNDASTAKVHQEVIALGTLVALPPGTNGATVNWAPIGSKEGIDILTSMQAAIGEGPFDMLLP